MPILHVAETRDDSRPLALISGYNKSITQAFINPLLPDFQCIILNNPHKYTASEHLYQVYNTAVGTITKLSEKLDYAVFFLSTQEDKRLLEQLIPKLEKDKPRTLFIIPIAQFSQFSDVLLATKRIPTVSYAVVGEMYGNDVPPSDSRISTVVYSAKKEKYAEFVSNELVSVYPVAVEDVLKGIKYVLFSKQKKERVYYFFYEHPQTIISTIHVLKRIEPDLQILYDTKPGEFPELPTHKDLESSIQAKSGLTPTYLNDIFDGFENTVKNLQYVSGKHPLLKRKRYTSRKKSIGKHKHKVRSAIFISIIALIVFLVVNVMLVLSGVVLAKQASASIKSGNFQRAQTQLSWAQHSFSYAKPTISLAFGLALKLPIPSIETSFHHFTSGVELTSLAATELSKVSKLQNGVSSSELLESIATLQYLYFTAQSNSVYSRLPYLDALTQPATSNTLATASVIPDILGYNSEKRYLLLFQNNAELRPTGGFIGSVGELIVEDGKIEDFRIQDVYDIDGQIKNHTEPPFIVRRYLQPHLYLRDSNFSLDFQEAATTSAQLYVNGGGKKVDGVVALDYEVLKTIIHKVGPLQLPTYNKEIDSESGFEFIQSTIDSTFTPGNSQKKDILAEIFAQLTLKLQEPKNVLLVAQELPKLIEQKHMLFAFKDPAVQEIFSTQKFAGSILNPDSDSKNINDYLSINEANIGVNKANIFISRSVSLNHTLQKNEMTSNATLTLDNDEGVDPYKVYVRFVVPRESEFEELSINGEKVKTIEAITSPRIYEASSFRPPNDVELNEEIYQNKKVFGFVHTVVNGKKDALTLSYSRKLNNLSSDFTYILTYQPQPGIHPTTVNLEISFPGEFYAKYKNSGIAAQKMLTVSEVITKDTEFVVGFEKK